MVVIRPTIINILPENPFSGCTTKQECFDRLCTIEDDIWESFLGKLYTNHDAELLGIELKYWQDFCAHHIVANGLDIEPLIGVNVLHLKI